MNTIIFCVTCVECLGEALQKERFPSHSIHVSAFAVYYRWVERKNVRGKATSRFANRKVLLMLGDRMGSVNGVWVGVYEERGAR